MMANLDNLSHTFDMKNSEAQRTLFRVEDTLSKLMEKHENNDFFNYNCRGLR